MTLTKGKTYTVEALDDLRQRVLDLRDRLSLSWSQITAESGIPVGTLQPWTKGEYKGDDQAVATRVETWLASRDERAAMIEATPSTPGFQPTPTATTILTRLKYAHHLDDFVMVSGGPGIGKTASVREYARSRSQVYVATASPSASGIQPMLMAILDQLGVPNAKGTPQRLASDVAAKLIANHAFLIVDEAQHLSVNAIEELRSLHDRTGCALAIVGNEDLFVRFAGVGEKGIHPQVTSRLGIRFSQAKPVAEDVVVLARAWGIEDPQIVKFLRMVSEKPGALRGVTKVLKLAFVLSAEMAPTLEDIRTAWSQLSTSPRGAA